MPSYRLIENADLRDMTTFRLPVPPVRLTVYADAEAALPELRRDGLLEGALLLGGGSNILFTGTRPIPTVVHPEGNAIKLVDDDGDTRLLQVDAGTVLDDLCRITADQNLWGMENLSGIPGHVGGAAVQNAGAYGTEMKDVVQSVHCYRPSDGTFLTLNAEECRYGYRDSVFKHTGVDDRLIICSITVRLSRRGAPNLTYKGLADALASAPGVQPSPFPSPADIRRTVLALRDSKLPRPDQAGSAGSFFKNPVVTAANLRSIEEKYGAPVNHHILPDGNAKLSAAWLIDKAGCKSLKHGYAILWPSQPLVLTNKDWKAAAADILALEKDVIRRVADTFGVELTPEVIHI